MTGLAGKDVATAVTKAQDGTSELVGTGIDYHFGDATSDQVLDAAGKASGDVSNAIVTGLADKDVAAAVAKARDSTSDLARTGIDYQFGDATSDQVIDAAGKTAGTISDAIVTDLAGSGSAEAVRRGREGVSELVGEAIDNLTETDRPATPANDNVETVQDGPDFSPSSDDSDVSNSGSQQLAGDRDDADASAQNDGVQDSVATSSNSYNDVTASDTSDASTVAAADSQSSSVASQDSYDTESDAQPVGDDSVDRAGSSDLYGAETDTRRDDGDVSDSVSAQDVGTVQSDAWGAPDGSTRADGAADDPGEPGQDDSYRSSQDNDDSSESGVRSDADAAGPTLATLNDSYGDEIPAPEPSSSDTSDFYEDPDSGGAYQAPAAGSDTQTSFQSETYNSSDDAMREVPDDNSDSYSETSIPDSVVETDSTSDDNASDAGAFTSTYSVSAGPEVTSDSDTGGGGYDAGSSGADIVAGSSGGESD
ncbi:hypothetical protein [Bradyrhizobium sp. BR 10289]|uniref:hypothetical protein n=1 Tax=Bradyrhizobium sp. BR 10289 TaxID=2749993 RepID=UPI001C654313|nr:hypothetical protein [Bradyrhizobium sp. BR 10289]MBW7968880.1 hypothetical protein [Bradyrhizobium sp. BR 10289]